MSFYTIDPYTPFPAAGAVGGWVELGRTTLGSAGDEITVSSLSDKRYYMILSHGIADSSNPVYSLRLGNGSIDTGTNYAWRGSTNGGADGTGTSETFSRWSGGGLDTGAGFYAGYIANLSGKEKLLFAHGCNGATAGAGTAPDRTEYVGKWTNTSNPLDYVNIHNINTGDFASGSEVVVLGWDPSDTHTNNFWEELDSSSLSSAASTFSSSNFTSKKYLWIQGFFKIPDTNAEDIHLRVGNSTIDTGSNYSRRRSSDGGADITATSQTYVQLDLGLAVTGSTHFVNIFIINNSSNEKLMTYHSITKGTAGAGTAPNRTEGVGKWTNTSNQIDIIQFLRGGSNIDAGSELRVWGAS